MKELSLWPLGGYVSSVPRMDVPLQCLTGDSKDWLVGRDRLRRRAGMAIFGDTLAGPDEVSGVLESKWSAKCRRLISASLDPLEDGFPGLLGLWVDEASKSATLAFRNTNDDSWQSVGEEFSATHYPQGRVPNFRCMPMVYENEYGGLTLHRMSEEEYRRHFAGGSRSLMQGRGQVAVPGFTSAPTRWDGGFNDDTDSGARACNIAPLGLVPPMQMPICSAGNDLGTTELGPWKGSDAFFFSVLFENEDGELSMYCIPRPDNSAYKGFPGFGYMHVDATNPTHYRDSIVYTNIPDGPPGTRWKRLMRSPKVDVSTTGAGSIVQPSADQLYFIPYARIPQGVHEYTDTSGNDTSLDADPRLESLMDLCWPPRARYGGFFDGHYALGCLKANPYALLVAPWMDGARNYPIADARLYGDPAYFVAVDEDHLVLRSVSGGVATDVEHNLADLTLRELTDKVTSNAADTTVTHTCSFRTAFSLGNPQTLTCEDGTFDDVYVGDIIVSSAFPAGTKVTRFDDFNPTTVLWVSERTTRNSATGGETVAFAHSEAADDVDWAMQPVPGADAGVKADELLRTRVELSATWSEDGTSITLQGSDVANAVHITPGMRVYLSGAFDTPTVVTAVNVTTGVVTISPGALRDSAGTLEAVLFAYDTGDSISASGEASAVAAVGTYSTEVAADLVSASVALATGSTIVVAFTTRSHDYGHAYFGGQLMTCAGSTGHGNAVTELWYFSNNSGATITAAASMRVGDDAASVMCVSTIAGTAATGSADQSAGTSGTGISADSGDTAALSQDDEVCIGIVGTDEGSLSGVFGGSWSDLNSKATASGTDVSVATAYKIVAADDAVSVTRDGLVVGTEWAALCVTFRVTTSTTVAQGFVRMYGNAFSVALPWRKSYLDQSKTDQQASIFSAASPGWAQGGINTWLTGNRRGGMAELGDHMGFADLGASQLEFYTRGRMLLHNPRTGETHNDDDYTKIVRSWTRGARSPYAIISGNGWAIYLSDGGFFVCEDGLGEVLLSNSVYDEGAPVGERGTLEYAISQCIIASENGSDAYKVAAQVHGSVLRVRYFKDADSTYFDRELRYDFSASVGREGMNEVLHADEKGNRSPYPWSPPLTIPISCSAEVVDATGSHLYAARDTNAGVTDGRVDEVDVGTTDNGALVKPMGYSGVEWPKGLNEVQVLTARILARKAGTGIGVGLCRDPGLEPSAAAYDDLVVPTSSAREYVRDLQPFNSAAKMVKEAVRFRVFDDGSGPCAEVALVLADSIEVAASRTKGGA